MKMRELPKSKIYGIIGSALFGMLLVLLLLSTFMPFNEKKMDEGVAISFGNEMEGEGFGKMLADIETNEQPEPESTTKDDPILTQESETAPVLAPKQEIRKKKPEKVVTKPLKNPQKEIDEKVKRAKQLAEENAKKTAETENLFKSAFGNDGTQEGVGELGGDNSKGTPAGKGHSNGHDWTLNGRGLLNGVVSPHYTSNVEGTVTVGIRVNASGIVTSVFISSPTDISDTKTREAAMKAAKKTRFSAGNGVAVGSIKYRFKLN